MSGGFRDTFTKEDTKEDILGYDDTAFCYFVITILLCCAVPWTLSTVCALPFSGKAISRRHLPARTRSGHALRYCATSQMVAKVEEARGRAQAWTRRSTCWWCTKAVVWLSLWIGIFSTVRYLRASGQTDISKFDPFALLDITPEASIALIRKSYRKLSLQYHPDKNPDDALAASRFILITKAYAALTDEGARRNWERYGNPDGPQTTKVGIGLPRILLQKEYSLHMLCAFFFVIIFMAPFAFICYYNRARNFAANGVLIETLQFLGYFINESVRDSACPELLAACAESRSLRVRATDQEQIRRLAGLVVERQKGVYTIPSVVKARYLVWAHLQRRHAWMSEELRADCDELLRLSLRVTQAMIEIACMREIFAVAFVMVDFRRRLVQALDVRRSQLLQVPHFDEEVVLECSASSEPLRTLEEFLATDAGRRKALLGGRLGPAELADIEAFCAHVGQVELRAEIGVEDESEIVVGDVATVTLALKRSLVHADEALGPVHAPLFPEPKFEEWWFFLVEAGEHEGIVTFERTLDTRQCVEVALRFQVTRPGKNTFVLHALCDSYVGVDQRVELSFDAVDEGDCVREYPVHEEDLDLDQQPTLFQQWMGDLAQADDSEEEGEGGGEPECGAAGSKGDVAHTDDSEDEVAEEAGESRCGPALQQASEGADGGSVAVGADRAEELRPQVARAEGIDLRQQTEGLEAVAACDGEGS